MQGQAASEAGIVEGVVSMKVNPRIRARRRSGGGRACLAAEVAMAGWMLKL